MFRTARLAVAVCLALAAPGGAAVIQLGPGSRADVAVEPSGRAHVTFKLANDRIAYCRIPRRATACDVRSELATPSNDPDDRPFLLRRAADGALFVLDHGFDAGSGPDSQWLHESRDAGATWLAPRQVSTLPQPTAVSISHDGLAIDVIADEPHRGLFQRIPLGPAPYQPAIDLGAPFKGDGIVTDHALTSLAGGGVLAVMSRGDGTGLRRFRTGNLYDQAAWTAWTGRSLPSDESEHALVSGRGGTWLITHPHITEQAGGTPPLLLRRFVRGRFGRGRRAGRGFTNARLDLAMDPRGGLHAVYHETRTDRLFYTRTRGRCWFGGATVNARGKGTFVFGGLRLGAGSATRAMAVWTTDSEQVRATWLTGGDKPRPRPKRRCPR